MIKQLKIERFGKFEHREFDFSPVTLFFGENESGKTTLFDSIFDSICSPGGNTVRGKSLKERYSSERKSELLFDGDEIHIDQDEFLNLYAIHSGKMNFEFSTGGEWLRRVKSSIFSGGIDPSVIAKSLDSEASEKANTRHMKKYKIRVSDLDRHKKKLEEMLEEKDRILSQEELVKQKDERLRKLRLQHNGLVEEMRDLEETEEQQKKIRERKRYSELLKQIHRGKDLRSIKQKLSRYADDETGELKGITSEITELQNRKIMKETQRETVSGEIRRKENTLQEKEQDLEKINTRKGLAVEFLSTIEKTRPGQVIRHTTEWNRVLLATAVVAALMGGTGALLLSLMMYRIASLAGGLLLFVLLFMLARRSVERHEDPDTGVFCNGIKDRWRTRGGGEIRSDTVDGIIMELQSVQLAFDSRTSEIAGIRGEIQDQMNELRSIEDDLTELQKQISEVKSSHEGWLRVRGISTAEEYAGMRSRYMNNQESLSEWEEMISGKITEHSADDLDSLEVLCSTRITAYDSEITEDELTEAQYRGVVKRVSELRAEEEEINRQTGLLNGDIRESRGKVAGSLGKIPEQVHDTEKMIEVCNRDIIQMKVTRDASALARDIFHEIASDSDIMFTKISEEISNNFADILPESREITLSEFDRNAFMVMDAGGEKRRTADLSSGTRDSFLFAARLAFARLSAGDSGPGLIVLDEPFYSFDRLRLKKALCLIRKFHLEHGWQVIIFSKDDDLKGLLLETFNDVTVHELQPMQ